MLSLELTAVPATLENFNSRTEKIGPDKVPAADLKFSCPQSADVLAFFSPTLKAWLFDEKSIDLAGGMALRDSHMIYPLARDEEMTGATVTLDYGVGDKMVFADAEINQFRLDPMNGGMVIVGFRVQCKPTEQQAGRLYMLQEKPVTITITPAELPKMKEAA
jgi:hypothetical protein